jgi:hypothetical protein
MRSLCSFPQPSPPLTEAHIQAVLQAAHCALLYRFDHVHVIDQMGWESHVCRREELPTMNVHPCG